MRSTRSRRRRRIFNGHRTHGGPVSAVVRLEYEYTPQQNIDKAIYEQRNQSQPRLQNIVALANCRGSGSILLAGSACWSICRNTRRMDWICYLVCVLVGDGRRRSRTYPPVCESDTANHLWNNGWHYGSKAVRFLADTYCWRGHLSRTWHVDNGGVGCNCVVAIQYHIHARSGVEPELRVPGKTLKPSCRSRVSKWKLARGNRVSVVVIRLKPLD